MKEGVKPGKVNPLVRLPLLLIMGPVELFLLALAFFSVPLSLGFAERVCRFAQTKLPDMGWYFGRQPNVRNEFRNKQTGDEK